MNQRDDFRDRLIASQQFTSKSREEYDRRLKDLMNGELTLGQKIGLGISVLVGLLGLIVIFAAFRMFNTAPQMKAPMALLGVVLLAITCIRSYILLTGRINRRTQPYLIAYIGFFGMLIFDVFLLASMAPHAGRAESTYIILSSLFPLILAVYKLISVQINQSELNIREKMLELELKLAETNEKLDKN